LFFPCYEGQQNIVYISTGHSSGLIFEGLHDESPGRISRSDEVRNLSKPPKISPPPVNPIDIALRRIAIPAESLFRLRRSFARNPFLSSAFSFAEQDAYVTRNLDEDQKNHGPTNAPHGDEQCPGSQGAHAGTGQVGGETARRRAPVFADDSCGHRKLVAAEKSENKTVTEKIKGVKVRLEKAGPHKK
jgi:hypothetical protein